MKKTIVIVILFISMGCSAQSFEEVVKVDSVSKSVLYKRAQRWFVKSFVDSKSIIQLQDSTNGEISGKGVYQTHTQVKGKTSDWTSVLDMQIVVEGTGSYFIQIICKEGRYKYLAQVENVNYTYVGRNYARNDETKKKIVDNITIQGNEKIKQLIEGLKSFMLKPSDFEKSNW